MTNLLKNPFNYTGAKYKLLPQLLPLFPKEIDTLIDVFGGSGEVSLNTPARSVIYNEKNISMATLMSQLNKGEYDFIKVVDEVIERYSLSKTNKEGYLKLREDYNNPISRKYPEIDSPMFYCLLAHSFNNQFSFNSKYEFNVPFGANRSSFNDSMRANLKGYVDKLWKDRIIVNNLGFEEIDFVEVTKENREGTFVYCDPPYLISCGAYERDYHCKWSKDLEIKLLDTLDKLNELGVKFGLSNVTRHKGMENTLLIEWAKKYNTHYLDKTYKNCSYQRSNKETETQEVFICNY